jgi:hypothetical protein
MWHTPCTETTVLLLTHAHPVQLVCGLSRYCLVLNGPVCGDFNFDICFRKLIYRCGKKKEALYFSIKMYDGALYS